MKYFMIKYVFKDGSRDAWHGEMETFIAALDGDPALAGKISYRCHRIRGRDDYFHIAGAIDDDAIKALQGNATFRAYQEKTRAVSGGTLEVVPLDIVAETRFRA